MSAKEEVVRLFPDLDRTRLKITSPKSDRYNCVAYAVGDTETVWEPDSLKYCYWPRNAPRTYTLMSYQSAFESVGFSLTSDAGYIEGFEKIAIFHKKGSPTHAAKQIADGLWSSKLGRSYDIQHDLPGMQGDEYGEIALFMQRVCKPEK